MRNIFITIEYFGKNYVGWQMQNNGVSIEQKICEAARSLLGHDIKLYGSGRTDSGVHALGQTANFYTSSGVPVGKIAGGLNAYLPEDIKVTKAEEKDMKFHARFDAKAKEYVYVIYNRSIMHPVLRDRATHVFYELDLEKMKRAAADLVGEHDFAGFMGSGSNVKNTVREIFDARFEIEGNIIRFYIRGNGFLYNMVRIIIATLIDIGRGRFEEDRIKKVLETGDRDLANVTAPPEGLYLKEVFY